MEKINGEFKKIKIEDYMQTPVGMLAMVVTARMEDLKIDQKYFPPIMDEIMNEIDEIIKNPQYENSKNNT